MDSLFSEILPVYTNGMRRGVLLKWKIKTSLFIGRKCYRDVAFVRFVVNIQRFICIVIKQTDKGQYWSCRYRFSGWNVNLDFIFNFSHVSNASVSPFCPLLFVVSCLSISLYTWILVSSSFASGTEIFNWKDTIFGSISRWHVRIGKLCFRSREISFHENPTKWTLMNFLLHSNNSWKRNMIYIIVEADKPE